MAHGKNARGKGHYWKEFYSRRPLSYYSKTKANKRICHGIERAQERELILKEKREI